MSRLLRNTFFLVMALVSGVSVRAQSVELILAPRESEVRPCDELAVEVRFRHDDGPAVTGYQLFLEFPAERFSILRFEPERLAGSVTVGGPQPIGGGFPGCSAASDPWDDGLGQDVVAVAATSIASGEEDGDAIEGEEALVGVLYFAPLDGADPDGGTFELSEESCSVIFDQRTKAFGPDGSVLDLAPVEAFVVSISGAGIPLEGLSCSLSAEDEVTLSWGDPSGAVEGVRVERDGAILAELPESVRSFVDAFGETSRADYRVTWIVDGSASCGAATCVVTKEVLFRRGDLDGRSGYTISDAVKLLGLLFRGEETLCADAADVNDDGGLNLTDAVFLLDFLFRSGTPIPPPSEELGEDPTEDTLDCVSFS